MAIKSSHHIYYEKGITLPITTEFQKIAQQFAQRCPFPDKAPQIKQNTLAVCAVNVYLQLMDIPTCVEESDSWNPMMQMMADVADLIVPGVGVFSCRAIAPDDTTCYIPPEDWHSRAGYVAVVIDEDAHQATLVGFTPNVGEIEQVPLTNFAPIETLIDRVHSLQASTSQAINLQANTLQGSDPEASTLQASTTEASTPQASTSQTTASASTAVTYLNQWIQETVAAGWQAAAALINPPELNFAFRASEGISGATDISHAKSIDLGIQLGYSLQVALVIHLAPVSENRSDIVIQVRPLGDSACLPEGISLSVFDENDALFRSATSRAIDNYIQIQVTGRSGETFSIQISKNEATFTERFII